MEQTFLGRKCQSSDGSNVMYPKWPPGDQLLPQQIDQVRSGAFHFEEGKTNTSLDGPSLSICGFKDQA